MEATAAKEQEDFTSNFRLVVRELGVAKSKIKNCMENSIVSVEHKNHLETLIANLELITKEIGETGERAIAANKAEATIEKAYEVGITPDTIRELVEGVITRMTQPEPEEQENSNGHND